LAQVLASDPDALEELLADADQGGTPQALNLALAGDGVFMEVAARTELAEPLHIVHLTSTALTAAFPRSVIKMGQGAKAVLVEHYIGEADGATLTNSVVRGHLEREAHLTHLKLQQEHDQAFHLADI